MKNCILITWRKLTLGLAVAAASALLPLADAVCQQMPEPSAVIAIASLDEQLNDVEYLAAATSETMGAMSGMARFQAQGFLPGVDFKKPAGALLYFKEGKDAPDSIAFFPVKSMEDILDKISEFAEVEEDGEFTTIVPDSGEELTITQQGDYAFVSNHAAMLKNLPTDPGTLIGEQGKTYNVSARVFPQRIPMALRQKAIDWIRESYESSLDQMSDLQAEINELQFETNMKQIEMAINDVDTLTFGMKIDKGTERVLIDINMKGKAGSEIEKKMVISKKAGPSQFYGFLMDQAAFTLHNCSGIAPDDAENAVKSLEAIRDTVLEEESEKFDEGEAEVLKRLSDKLIETVKKTLMAGTMDMGGVAFTNDGINAAFGAKIVDAREFESTVKEIVAEAESKLDGDQVVFNMNSGSHAGFSLHEISVAIDDEEYDDSVKKMFGDRLNLMLGIGDDKVYLGVGKDPGTTLKKSIDANAGSSAGKGDLIGQYNLFLAPIMNLVAQIESDEPMVEDMRQKIQEVGKDRVRFTYDVVDKEMKMQIEIQDGIFQLLGVFSEAMQGGMGGADF